MSVSFPSMFALVANKEALVVDVWDFSSEEGCWTLQFSRPLNDWEFEEVVSFFHPLQDKKVFMDRDDKLLLKETKDELFYVKRL